MHRYVHLMIYSDDGSKILSNTYYWVLETLPQKDELICLETTNKTGKPDRTFVKVFCVVHVFDTRLSAAVQYAILAKFFVTESIKVSDFITILN